MDSLTFGGMKLESMSVGLEESVLRAIFPGTLGEPVGEWGELFENATRMSVSEVVKYAERKRIKREAAW